LAHLLDAVGRHGELTHLHQLGLARMGRFQDVGALALVGDGHVGRGGAVLAGCRSRPGIGDVDAAGLGCPHGKTDEYDGSKSEEESDANLEDTELGQPAHFASLQSSAGMAAPATIPRWVAFPLVYAAPEAVSCALVSR